MHRLFEGHEHAKLYAQYRPVYPQGVVDAVLDFAKKTDQTPPFDHILDVGCGNGQATKLFASYAKKITATDVSENQIKQAISSNEYVNIEYCVGKGEEIPVEDASVDIITSAQAIHWVDLVKFFAECERVLKPDGLVVLFGYDFERYKNVGKSEGMDEETRIANIKRSNESLLKSMSALPWNPRTKLVDEHYKSIFKMMPSNSKVRKDDMKIRRSMTLEDIYKYHCTGSGYQSYMQSIREEILQSGGEVSHEELRKHDVAANFVDDLRQIWGITEANSITEADIEEDVFLLMSYRPFHSIHFIQ